MTQFVTRLDETLASRVDALVADGVVASRSDAVRLGLAILIDREARRRTADQIVQGYLDRPQTDDEVAWADAATVRMIEEESW